MNALDNLRNWFESLQPRERLMVVLTSIVVVITLFYVAVWEPLHKGLQQELEKRDNLQASLAWMQGAAQEVRALRAAGVSGQRRNDNAPVSLTIEKTAASSGIKSKLGKLESSGKNAARARLDNVDFNQMILWLNTVEQNYGIAASSVNIESTDKPGIVNARISFSRDG